jgi:hypothetical protein
MKKADKMKGTMLFMSILLFASCISKAKIAGSIDAPAAIIDRNIDKLIGSYGEPEDFTMSIAADSIREQAAQLSTLSQRYKNLRIQEYLQHYLVNTQTFLLLSRSPKLNLPIAASSIASLTSSRAELRAFVARYKRR